MKKHAYLIMAHTDFELLITLLKLLDDERNDIYVHIDTKAQGVPIDRIKESVQASKISIYQKMHVLWGSYRQIQCELFLMHQAKKDNTYAYYHLLSGVDLPLKTQDEIHDFFCKHQGKEFLHFTDREIIKSRHCYERMRFYSFFQGYNKSKYKMVRFVYEIFNAISIHLQMLFGVNRIKNMKEKLAFGANWFSLTDRAITYVLSQEDWIKKHFRYTRCCDEMFIHMLIYNSYLFENVYHKVQENNFSAKPAMRFIDWDRGNPYVYRKEDYEMLIQSDMLYARKFSTLINRDIVLKISKNLTNKKVGK